MAVSMEGTAHECLKAGTLYVKDDGEWNVQITPQVDVMCVGDVVDDEVTRNEFFMMSVIVMRRMCVSAFGVLSMLTVGVMRLVCSMGLVGVTVALHSMSVILCKDGCPCDKEQGGEEGPE